MKFSTFIIGLLIAMCVIVIYGVSNLENHKDSCKEKAGIMVQTPNGWHCLTKDDLK